MEDRLWVRVKVRKGGWGMGWVWEGMKEVIRWDKVGVGGNKV